MKSEEFIIINELVSACMCVCVVVVVAAVVA